MPIDRVSELLSRMARLIASREHTALVAAGPDGVQGLAIMLFGEERADELRTRLTPLTPKQRELAIVGELCQALRELGPEYVLPFRFKDDHGSRTSHHLIFVSKGFKGYEIMKEIMAKESSDADQGVASFEYNPVDARIAAQQQLLFELSRPLDDLGDILLKEFSGQKLMMRQIYERHNVNRPYTKKNYKQVLTHWDLEQQFGLSEGNIFHGELSLEQLLFLRPVPGWARYETPIRHLWMCGSATHPGGGIMGAPGRNAARRILGVA